MAVINSPQNTEAKRLRYDELDWLRVLAFGTLIIYHLAMMYVESWDWHIKSDYQSEWLQYLMLAVNQWRMPLLFFISGAVLAFVMPRLTLRRFILLRHTRLLLPLVVGCILVIPVQVYFEILYKNIAGHTEYFSYWDFFLAYWRSDGIDVFGSDYAPFFAHFTWNHLWYLAYLFVFSFLFLPFYYLLEKTRCQYLMQFLALRCNALWLLLSFSLVFVIIAELFWTPAPRRQDFINDLYMLGIYFVVFMFGYWAARYKRVWDCIKENRSWFLILYIVSTALILALHNAKGLHNLLGIENTVFLAVSDGIIWRMNMLSGMLMVVGFSSRYLARPNLRIKALNEAIIVYYIFHQTIIIALGYNISQYQLGPILEPLIIFSLTIAGCGLSYYIVKNIRPIRPLFGLK